MATGGRRSETSGLVAPPLKKHQGAQRGDVDQQLAEQFGRRCRVRMPGPPDSAAPLNSAVMAMTPAAGAVGSGMSRVPGSSRVSAAISASASQRKRDQAAQVGELVGAAGA